MNKPSISEGENEGTLNIVCPCGQHLTVDGTGDTFKLIIGEKENEEETTGGGSTEEKPENTPKGKNAFTKWIGKD